MEWISVINPSTHHWQPHPAAPVRRVMRVKLVEIACCCGVIGESALPVLTPMDSFRIFATVALLLSSAAARAKVFTINNTLDHGPGTLRNALASAAADSGPDIINIPPRFNGGRLILDSQLTVSGDPDVTIDVSALDAGFTIATDLKAASSNDKNISHILGDVQVILSPEGRVLTIITH
jgi:hypothetical protein